jgi:hypothetical protein
MRLTRRNCCAPYFAPAKAHSRPGVGNAEVAKVVAFSLVTLQAASGLSTLLTALIRGLQERGLPLARLG